MSGSSTYTVPFYIDGEQRLAKDSFEVFSPAGGELLHRCGNAGIDDADAAVKAASEAFVTWRRTTPAYRRDVFLRAAEIMLARREELNQYIIDELGCPKAWADFNIDTAVDFIKDAAGRISTLEGTFPAIKDADYSAIVLREPYGVVVSIAPWNAPYILGCRAIIYPIATGNTVVLKASELAPRTLTAIVSIFHEAGLPKGVCNSISHSPANAAAVTSALISDPRVRKINFTGSTNVGRIIGKLAGENLKPVVLELGGKAPAIVWEDADIETAARHCVLGSFLNSGQICMSTEKILVHKNIKGAFREKLAAVIEEMMPSSQGPPVLINGAAVSKNKKLVSEALSKGASVLVGDANAQEIKNTMMRPIVLDNVTREMDIYQTESFGPTVSLIDIESEEEAIALANDTEYGLSSAVFTEDLRRGLRFARAIDSGAVHINSMSVHDEPLLPHGGAKSSGFGRFNSSPGFDEWVWTKSVTFKN